MSTRKMCLKKPAKMSIRPIFNLITVSKMALSGGQNTIG